MGLTKEQWLKKQKKLEELNAEENKPLIQKMAEGFGSGFTTGLTGSTPEQLKTLVSGGSSPEQIGLRAKTIGTAPLAIAGNIYTAGLPAVIGGVIGAGSKIPGVVEGVQKTGEFLNKNLKMPEFIQKGAEDIYNVLENEVFNKLPKGTKETAQAITKEAIPPTLEILATLGMKGLKPISITGGSKKIDISGVNKKIKEAVDKPAGETQENLIKSYNQAIDEVHNKIYAPMRGKIDDAKTPFFVGKKSSLETKAYITELVNKGKLTTQEATPLFKLADEMANHNTISNLLNFRQANDRGFSTLKASFGADAPKQMTDYIDLVNSKVRKIINKNIEDAVGITNPELLTEMKAANRIYSTLKNNQRKVEKIMSSENEVFNKIVSGGVPKIKNIQAISGKAKVMESGYDYITKNAFDLNKNFSPKTFSSGIQKLNRGQGQAIFGQDWDKIVELAKIMQDKGFLGNFKGMAFIKNAQLLKDGLKAMKEIDLQKLLDRDYITIKEKLIAKGLGENIAKTTALTGAGMVNE